MRLTVVGCGDAFGSGGRGNTCFHVASGDAAAVLDFGGSAIVGCQRFGVDPAGIGHVFLSHLHGDHFGGLPFLLLDGQFVHRRAEPLVIVGPPGTRARLKAALDALFPDTDSFEWRYFWSVEELEPGATGTFGPWTLTSALVVHDSGAPSTALRLSDGARTIAFSGDTEWTQALIPIAREADLFICESSQFEGRPVGHLSYATVAAQRPALAARHILLSHMGDAMWARRDEVDGAHFTVAQDGLVYDL